MKTIGIIGSGAVGRTLANGFIKHGFSVMIGTGNQAKLSNWKDQSGSSGHTGSFSDAAGFGDIVVLAVKGTAAVEIIKGLGNDALSGKTVIDATNPIDNLPPVNGVLQYFTQQNGSLMEELQALAPGANFVKAFSSVGSANMVNPDFNGIRPTMFICGNNENSKKTVTEILDNFGWETEDMGGAEAARAIEPLAMLWCIPGFRHNTWTHAFKLLKR